VSLPGRGRPGWSLAVVVVAALVAVPVAAVVLYAADGGLPALPVGIGRMVRQTALLLLGVGVGTLLLGCGLAWLTTAYRFPGRDVLVWLLVLPLAMPAYILGFVFLSTFDVAGDLQVWLREMTGTGLEVPVRGLGGAAVVMSLTLYPYVYLLARTAFAEQTSVTWDAARLLGASRRRAFFGVLLPLARPSLAAGLALVMMEVLTDFATVQYFGVRTVSVGVYSTWRQSYDFASAVQLASFVLLFAVAVLAGERLVRGRARFTQRGGTGGGPQPARLTGPAGWAATGTCLLVLAGGFAVPVVQLLVWGLRQVAGKGQPVDPRFGGYLVNSVVLALLAAACCVGLAVVIGHALRLGGGRVVRASAQLTTFGYAVPGAVVGIGTLLTLAALDDGLEVLGVPGGTGLLVTGSLAAILFAYVVRFAGPAFQAVDASYTKLRPGLTQSALVLGAGPWRVLTRVHLPLVRPGVGVALVLVAVDAIKELPVVLLLRPFGFTTVSVWVYQLASENLWSLAALPALVIVALATVPVVVLFRQVRRQDRGVALRAAGTGSG
jgi:iron(III) transport system permease protein